MVWVLPILHPAHILRGRWALEPAQILALKRAWAIAQGEEPVLPSIDELPVPAILFPTLLDLTRFANGPIREGLVLDIETAGPHLICVGMLREYDQHAIVLPFRKQGGSLYWGTWQEHLAATWWLYTILADPAIPKTFHNGQAFDVPFLTDLGFKVEGYNFDTLLAQHTAYSEMPKALQFCATVYCGLPGWKHLADAEDKEEGK